MRINDLSNNYFVQPIKSKDYMQKLSDGNQRNKRKSQSNKNKNNKNNEFRDIFDSKRNSEI